METKQIGYRQCCYVIMSGIFYAKHNKIKLANIGYMIKTVGNNYDYLYASEKRFVYRIVPKKRFLEDGTVQIFV